jgi:hypothetical protein
MAGRRRRGGLGWILGIVVVLGLAWVGYWYAAHYFAEKTIARLNAAPVNGKKIGCTDVVLEGFPLRLDFRCDRGTYAAAGDRITAELGGVDASAPLYWPGYVEANLTGPFVVNAPDLGVALTTSWSAGTANATAGIGGLQGAGASFVSLKADNTGALPGVPVKSASADIANASIAPAGGGSYAIKANAKRLALTRADGSALPDIDGDIAVTALNVGGSLGTDPARALLTWLRGSPAANVERLRIVMGGAIVAASGNLSVSPEGLLSGSILLRYNSIEALGNLIETLKPGTRDRQEVQLALQGLQMMSAPTAAEDGTALQTTISIKDGLVGVGIVPIGVLPALQF